MNGHLEAARLLIDRGAAVDSKDKDGKTPLDKALENDKNDVAAYLREAIESKSKRSKEEEKKKTDEARLKAEEGARLKAEASSQQSKQESKDMKYHCFLTHNWGKRQSDGTYDNHERVRRIYNGLESMNVTCWFDSERMTGTINEQMSKGIDDSDCVIGIALLLLSLLLS